VACKIDLKRVNLELTTHPRHTMQPSTFRNPAWPSYP
jgi:hypothetical protein